MSSIWLRISLAAAFDVLLGPCAVDDRRVVLVDRDALGLAQVLEGHVLELETEFLGDDLATRENSHVLQHRLAAIAEARSLDRRHVERASDLVDDEGCESFALDVLGDDQKRLALACDLLEQGQQVLHVADLLLVKKDERFFQSDFHSLRIGHEVRREVAPVELHALDHVELGLEALALFDRDHAFLADLLHGFGEDAADRLVVVGRNGADLCDLPQNHGSAFDIFSEFGTDGTDGSIDATLEFHGVHAGDDELGALAEDRLSENGCGGRAVAGDVGGLAGDLLHHLSAHVLEA